MSKIKILSILIPIVTLVFIIYFYKETEINKDFLITNKTQFFFIFLISSPFLLFSIKKHTEKQKKKFFIFIFFELILIFLTDFLKKILRKKRPDMLNRFMIYIVNLNIPKEDLKISDLDFIYKKFLREISSSFPSFHSTMSFYSFLYLNENISNFKFKSLNFIFLILSNLERIVYNKHRIVDLIGGSSLSFLIYEIKKLIFSNFLKYF